MTEEIAQTYEYQLEPDYTQVLEDIRSEVQFQTELIQTIQAQQAEQGQLLDTYIPELHTVAVLFLGSFIAVIVFRLLLSFLGRVFNDTTKF